MESRNVRTDITTNARSCYDSGGFVFFTGMEAR